MRDSVIGRELTRLGFHSGRWLAVSAWERPVSNGRWLSVSESEPGSATASQAADGPLNIYLCDERYQDDRVHGSWLRQTLPQLLEILVDVDNSVPPLHVTSVRGVPFICRLLAAGDRYGFDGRHTVEPSDSPMLAFYDARYPNTAYGQYLGSLYVLETFLAHDGPLRLNEAEREWTLDAASVALAQHWAKLETARLSVNRNWGPLADVRRYLRHPETGHIALPIPGRRDASANANPDSVAEAADRRNSPGFSM